MKRAWVAILWLVCACGGEGGDTDATGPADPGSPDGAVLDVADVAPDPGDGDLSDREGVDGAGQDASPDDGEPAIDPLCAAVAVQRANELSVDGTTRRFLLNGPDSAIGPGGSWPVVFLWHGFNGVAFSDDKDDYLAASYFANRLGPQSRDEDFPFLLVTPLADGVAVLDWNILDVYDGDTNPDVRLFDEVLDCLDARYGVDRDRVHSVGFSAGAIMTDLLGVARGEQLASTLTWSGGYIANGANETGEFEIIWPDPGPSSGWTQVVFRGGPNDVWGAANLLTIDFDAWVRNDVSWLNDLGHDVIECAHTFGHQIPPGSMDYVAAFFRAHPRGTTSSPWADALPDSLPGECTFHPGME